MARRAQMKGKIEAPFLYVEKNLLGGMDFEKLEDLRAMARWWLREKSDHHRHDATGRPPLELFLEEEKDFAADILSLKATAPCFSSSPGANRTVEDPGHRTTKSLRWGLEPVKKAFLTLGEQADAFLSGLKEKHRNCGFHIRFILRLKERFHSDDIYKALD